MFNPSYGGESDEFSDRTLNKVMRKIDYEKGGTPALMGGGSVSSDYNLNNK